MIMQKLQNQAMLKKSNSREIELIEKLLFKHHLSVPERNELPDKTARASICQFVIKKHLSINDVFPGKKRYPVGENAGEYIQLEKNKKGYYIHVSSEYSLLKYKQKFTFYKNKDEAIKKYLNILESQELLDGVVIDWNA